ncbi:MAG: hypothetical protein IMW86_04235 [Hydrogenibacillus sp.]|nr:hypothetical protein [Hydrogenibacillus sp.]
MSTRLRGRCRIVAVFTADTPNRVVVDGKALSFEVLPQIVGGRVIASVKTVKETLFRFLKIEPMGYSVRDRCHFTATNGHVVIENVHHSITYGKMALFCDLIHEIQGVEEKVGPCRL